MAGWGWGGGLTCLVLTSGKPKLDNDHNSVTDKIPKTKKNIYTALPPLLRVVRVLDTPTLHLVFPFFQSSSHITKSTLKATFQGTHEGRRAHTHTHTSPRPCRAQFPRRTGSGEGGKALTRRRTDREPSSATPSSRAAALTDAAAAPSSGPPPPLPPRSQPPLPTSLLPLPLPALSPSSLPPSPSLLSLPPFLLLPFSSSSPKPQRFLPYCSILEHFLVPFFLSLSLSGSPSPLSFCLSPPCHSSNLIFASSLSCLFPPYLICTSPSPSPSSSIIPKPFHTPRLYPPPPP